VRTGTLFAIISIAALISNPIGGALITRWNGDYTGLQIYCGVMTFAGYVQSWPSLYYLLTSTSACVLTLSRVSKVGWKVNVKY
jgi:hypothetical protein